MKRSAALAAIVALCAAALLFAADPAAPPAGTPPPARPRVLGISHVALWVHDIAASRAFYKDFLGFGEPYSLPKVGDPNLLHLTFIKINDRQVIELFPETQPATD